VAVVYIYLLIKALESDRIDDLEDRIVKLEDTVDEIENKSTKTQ
jgi:hypothetical protein